MANLMLLDYCNLKCPYCFADEYVNKNHNEMSEDAFNKAVEFILKDKSEKRIGIIGGEPTLHPKFADFLRKLILDDRIETIVLYTNGIRIDEHWNLLSNKKVRMLINVNSPRDMGEALFGRIVANLDHAFNDLLLYGNVTLGINMYKKDFDYDYLIDLLKKYGLHTVRVSITVPDHDSRGIVDASGHFEEIKPRMLEFFETLLQNDIVPNFDCNKIPSCFIEEKDLKRLKGYLKKESVAKYLNGSNIMTTRVLCRPVIDILPDMTAIRCFGLSEFTKQRIDDFSGIQELERFYLNTVDAYACNTAYMKKCIDCHRRETLTCMGGCISFKMDQIRKMQEFARNQMEELV